MVRSNNYPEIVVTISIFLSDINKKNFPGQEFNRELSIIFLYIFNLFFIVPPNIIQLLI